jgi:hypothetical protein
MKYNGSCHCGKIAFEAEGEIKGDAVPVQHFDGRAR